MGSVPLNIGLRGEHGAEASSVKFSDTGGQALRVPALYQVID
jgi:hypothetical protein